jgi:hypothetical protein
MLRSVASGNGSLFFLSPPAISASPIEIGRPFRPFQFRKTALPPLHPDEKNRTMKAWRTSIEYHGRSPVEPATGLPECAYRKVFSKSFLKGAVTTWGVHDPSNQEE